MTRRQYGKTNTSEFPQEEVEQYYKSRLDRWDFHHVKGNEFRAMCLLHGGDNPSSLWINIETGGFCCFACGVKGGGIYAFEQEVLRRESTSGQAPESGRVTESIRQVLGIPFSERVYTGNWDRKQARDWYPYTNELEKELYRVYKFVDANGNKITPPDHACPCSSNPDAECERGCVGGRVWGLGKISRVLYRLISVIQALLVFIVEGEPNVNDLARALALYISKHGGFRLGNQMLDRVAVTTNIGGAGGWKPEYGYGKSFVNKFVIKLGDNDEASRKHDRMVCEDVYPYAFQLFTLVLPVAEGEDISDFIRQRGATAIDDLIRLLETDRKPYKPSEASAASDHGYQLISLKDLFAKPDVPRDWTWNERLCAATMSMVVAKPKVGKGTKARNLALSVATGQPFLGMECKQGTVVYLALEECEEDVKDDFRALGATGDEPIHIHAAPAPQDAVPELVALVRRVRPRLLVVDPIVRLTRIRDENAYAENYAALGPLVDIARECGTHIMVLHHSGKTSKADAIDSPLGSTAYGGVPATLIYLRRTSEGYRTIQTVQRIGKDLPETVLVFDEASKRLTTSGMTRQQKDEHDAGQRIVDYMRQARDPQTGELTNEPTGQPLPQTEKAIRENVEGSTKVLFTALKGLLKGKIVERSGGGKRGDPYIYKFPSEQPPETPSESFLFSCSHPMPRTREQETKNGPQARMDIEEKVVPAFPEKTDLAPAKRLP
jgi:hypothetical protein